jgi:hypothetical protein
MFESHAVPRRRFLQLSGAAGAMSLLGSRAAGAAPAATASASGPAAADGSTDYLDRSTFDADYAAFRATPGGADDANNEAGALAWGKSYSLLSLIRMYQAYDDPRYLDTFIDGADAVLAQRDRDRGVTDYRGLSLPAWRTGDRYTSGIVRLADADGRPSLEIRSAEGSSGSSVATITADEGADTFTVTVLNTVANVSRTYAGLSMDPSSPDYAPARIYQAYDGTARITARDLRPRPDAAGNPAPGRFDFVGQFVIFAVHTGMVVYPIAYFALVVLSDPRLRTDRRYRSTAERYIVAARQAAQVHDREWFESVDGGVRVGSYRWVKGMPLPWDGCEQPLNQSLGLGQALAVLSQLTRNPEFAHKATLLSAKLSTQLITDDTGSDVWHYWPTTSELYTGYLRTGDPATDVSLFTPEYAGGNPAIDDVSHGAITVECAVRFAAAGRGPVGDADLDRMARTYSEHLAETGADGLPTVATRLDGTGVATSGYYLQSPRWMALAPRNPEIFTQSLAIYQARQPVATSGSNLLGVAYLQWYNRLFAS